MFTSLDENVLTREAQETLKGQDFYVSERQVYEVLTYFHKKFACLKRIGDTATLHDKAKRLAHEIKEYPSHELREPVKFLVDYLPAWKLF